jgi:hypothetical protein
LDRSHDATGVRDEIGGVETKRCAETMFEDSIQIFLCCIQLYTLVFRKCQRVARLHVQNLLSTCGHRWPQHMISSHEDEVYMTYKSIDTPKLCVHEIPAQIEVTSAQHL